MAWVTMHWTLFADPGWVVVSCATPRCELKGGGNYAALVSPDGGHMTVIVETFLHSASKCIRQDPPDWTVSPQQTVTIAIPATAASHTSLDVWRSCTGWRYPAMDDSYMVGRGSVKSCSRTP